MWPLALLRRAQNVDGAVPHGPIVMNFHVTGQNSGIN